MTDDTHEVEPEPAEQETVDIHTVYLSPDDKDAASTLANIQGVTASAVLRSIFDSYLAGKLNVVKDETVKTSLWISPEKWEAVRAKASAEKVPIRSIIAAGIRRLTTGK